MVLGDVKERGPVGVSATCRVVGDERLGEPGQRQPLLIRPWSGASRRSTTRY